MVVQTETECIITLFLLINPTNFFSSQVAYK